MKKLLTLTLMLLFSFGAQASTVTIDFNEVTPVVPPFEENRPRFFEVQSKGYTLQAGGTGCGSPDETGGGVNANGIFFTTPVSEPAICRGQITMERTGGGAFSIHSLVAASDTGPGFFVGTLSDGGDADLTSQIGTGDWLDLQFLLYTSENFQFGDHFIRLDDISVSAVPVPAAVWLFASGLGLLGLTRRRKQTS